MSIKDALIAYHAYLEPHKGKSNREVWGAGWPSDLARQAMQDLRQTEGWKGALGRPWTWAAMAETRILDLEEANESMRRILE